MKYLHMLTAVLAILFTTNTMAQQRDALPAQDATGVSISDLKQNTDRFNQIISTINTKSIPLNDATNFDSFIDEDDYKDVDVKTLKLVNLYPNFYAEGYNYRAISWYKIEFSEDFYSVVVTIRKGDNEMESTLINYDLKGNIIDSLVIAYDEIAEGFMRTESKIEAHRLTVNNIQWIEEKKVETTVFKIEANGKIKQLSNDEILIDTVIQQLGIEYSKINMHLLVTKVMPNSHQETIMVIPEFTEGNDDEPFFQLNCHILIVNTITEQITHKYSENGLTSDALQLTEITIDTARYIVSEDTRAFGVKVFYYANSKGSPYSNTTMALFVKSEDSLNKILNHYDIMEYNGEWDGFCYGEFTDVKNTLIMSKEKTNGYFDIIVNSAITNTENHEDENGDCISKESKTISKLLLKFNGKVYN